MDKGKIFDEMGLVSLAKKARGEKICDDPWDHFVRVPPKWVIGMSSSFGVSSASFGIRDSLAWRPRIKKIQKKNKPANKGTYASPKEVEAYIRRMSAKYNNLKG